MCKYCDMTDNKTVGYSTGKVLLPYSATYLIKRPDGVYLSDRLLSPELQVNYCPICGKALVDTINKDELIAKTFYDYLNKMAIDCEEDVYQRETIYDSCPEIVCKLLRIVKGEKL